MLVSAGFESCGEDEYASRLRELILKDMTFGANEDEGALSKTTTFRNEDISNYRAVSNSGWCHVALDASKSQMTVTVDENTTYGERKATVTMSDVKAPEISRTFTVTQKQNNAIIVDKTYFEVETKGGQLEIDFEHNINDFEISSFKIYFFQY